jgi:hypothetical protein
MIGVRVQNGIRVSYQDRVAFPNPFDRFARNA